MKNFFSIFFFVLLFSLNIYADEWVSDKGQKLTFINKTPIMIKDTFLADFGPELTHWKNAIMSLSITKDGNVFCDISISTDDYKLSRTQDWVRYSLYCKLYNNIEDEKQKNDFLSIGFTVRFRNEFSRGLIEQYASLQHNHGMVVVYPDTHLESGRYTADLRYNSNYDLFPKYNAATQSWNAAYILYYITGEFEEIKDIPVPPGLDASFKNDFERIPTVIEENDWHTFNSFVVKYNLKISNYFSALLSNKAPITVFQNFSENQIKNLNYNDYITQICENIEYIIFFKKYFDKAENELLSEYFKNHPDIYVDFCRKGNLGFVNLEPGVPENFIINCSVDNVEYITKNFRTEALTSVLKQLQTEKIEKILKNRKDNTSEFLRFYYLEFDSVSGDKIVSFINDLKTTPTNLLMTNLYDVKKPIMDLLLSDRKYIPILKDLFDRNILKILISNSNDFYLTTDYEYSGIRFSYQNSPEFFTPFMKDSIYEIAYKIYSGELIIDEIFSPNSIISNHCKISLQFDNGEDYSLSKKKSGSFLFGELKNGKIYKKDLTITNMQNETLLFCSIRNGNDTLSQQLIKDGIDISIKNTEGKTALDIAAEFGNSKIQKLLRK